MGLLGLQPLPFMESSQIICCRSHVAEKIQETLPHWKKVNDSRRDQGNLCIYGESSCSYRSESGGTLILIFLLFNSLIHNISSAFHNAHHPSTLYVFLLYTGTNILQPVVLFVCILVCIFVTCVHFV